MEVRDRVKHTHLAAALYDNRKTAKHEQEIKLVQSAMTQLKEEAIHTVLDAPCGVGRMTGLLQSMGFVARGCDLGKAAIDLAREKAAKNNVNIEFDIADLQNLPYQDNQFDATLCFRFFHHLSDKNMQAKVIEELCRVSDRHVLISIFSPYSYTSIKREIRQKFGGKASIQHTTQLPVLDDLFKAHQFSRKALIKQPIPLKTLQLVIYSKDD